MVTSAAIKLRARDCGFDLCGIARADRHPKLARFGDWLDQGRAGDMRYLHESRDERLDPAQVLRSARSIVSLGVVYNTPDTQRRRDTGSRRDSGGTGDDTDNRAGSGEAEIARYARGEDYHDVLRARLRALLEWIAAEAGPGLEAFSCVDNGPIQERVFAEQAGLGWIGKNTCVINPAIGSWFVLAEILTNLDLEPDAPAVDQCGTCTRCLDACPTGALTAAYELDATRCLSYLTIETRAPVDAALRPQISAQVYGCDICQDVCPWNRRAAVSDDLAWQPRAGLDAPRLVDLCTMSDDAWRALIKGSAMRRAGLKRIRRSLAYAAASLDSPERTAAIAALAAHPSGQDPDVIDGLDWAGSRDAGRSER
ncbi:MAG TPA: tRNA epoxyqueuosine(34) reductase QueG [Vicinamibacterales bacterium]|nr:tRNA epoxyqueuosine(34) reductase QueG [Vicinamibacterales bacterium]